MIVENILCLLKFQPKPLEHYGKYALSITIPILLVMSLAFGFFVPIDPTISTDTNIAIHLISIPIASVCGSLFFKYWLGRRQKIFTFQALFNVLILASIVNIIPLEFLDINTTLYWVLFIALLCYSFAIVIFMMARGAEVSLGYAISGSLIAFVIVIILAVLLIFALIALGLMTLPPVPSA